MIEDKFYRCIPELNKECKKNNCYINGGECEMTIYKEYTLKGLLEEIERLNKRIEDLNTINEEHQILNGMIRKELQQKENIIKEAIEYIKKHGDYNKSSGCIEELDLYKINELLEILNKGE